MVDDVLKGRIRLNDVRNLFYDDELTFDQVLKIHREWKNQDEYCVIAYPKAGEKQVKNCRTGLFEFHSFDYYGFKVSKRGNDVYQGRVKRRLNPLLSFMSDNKNKLLFEPNNRSGETNVLMVTLTYDAKRNGITKAWLDQGNDFNTFLSRLKQKYGSISVLRSWERFRNGYPHVHAIIVFHNHNFRVRRHTNKKGKIQWLIPDCDNKIISSFHHSFVQQSGVYSFGGVSYVAKYICKKVFEKEDNPTLVACWLYGRRQWSISKDFIQSLHECFPESNMVDSRLDLLMHNSSNDFGFDRISFFVGVKIIENASFNLVLLKPPPIESDPSDVYDSHSEWLVDFEIADCVCDCCGKRLFISDTYKIETEKGKKLLCKTCYESF